MFRLNTELSNFHLRVVSRIPRLARGQLPPALLRWPKVQSAASAPLNRPVHHSPPDIDHFGSAPHSVVNASAVLQDSAERIFLESSRFADKRRSFIPHSFPGVHVQRKQPTDLKSASAVNFSKGWLSTSIYSHEITLQLIISSCCTHTIPIFDCINRFFFVRAEISFFFFKVFYCWFHVKNIELPHVWIVLPSCRLTKFFLCCTFSLLSQNFDCRSDLRSGGFMD